MISSILQYSTIDFRFLEANLKQLSKFSDEIIVPICDHMFNGNEENRYLLEKSITIIESYPNATPVLFEWQGSDKSPRYYHNLSRSVGTNTANNEWLLFVDADEIVSDEFNPWFETIKDSNNSYWFTCYWYFREATYRAVTTEGAGLLTKKQYCEWNLYSEQERQQLFNKLPNFYNGDYTSIVSNTGQPLVHHFSWVRTKQEMIDKVSNWGHASDKDWLRLVENEFSRPFNGTDFVHGYNYVTVDNIFNI